MSETTHAQPTSIEAMFVQVASGLTSGDNTITLRGPAAARYSSPTGQSAS